MRTVPAAEPSLRTLEPSGSMLVRSARKNHTMMLPNSTLHPQGTRADVNWARARKERARQLCAEVGRRTWI